LSRRVIPRRARVRQALDEPVRDLALAGRVDQIFMIEMAL
jgi:hypothetical protein